jgi:hypothetical protein
VSPKAFQRLLERDLGRCLHCGATEALSPNHRANRGMGGSKARDRAANLVVLCSIYNGQIESDKWARAEAIAFGWKIHSWEDPLSVPVMDRMSGTWYWLNDEFERVELDRGKKPLELRSQDSKGNE